MRPGLFVFLLLIGSNVMAAKTPLFVGAWRNENDVWIVRPNGTAYSTSRGGEECKWKAANKTGYEFLIWRPNGGITQVRINKDKKNLSGFVPPDARWQMVRELYPPPEKATKKKPAKPVKKQPARQNKTDEADFGFKSLGARKAIRDYKATHAKEDKAKQKAIEEIEAEAKKAQKTNRVELIMNLEQALKKALQDADLEEANKIDAAIKALKKGAGPAGASATGSKGRKKAKKSKARIPRDAVEYKGHHYKVYAGGVPHSVAQKQCEMMGGHLARIQNSGEQKFLIRILANSKRRAHWLDGSDAEKESVWKFSDGTRMKYFAWAAGEPSNSGGDRYGQHYLLIHKWNGDGEINVRYDGRWDDDNEGVRDVGFICEWDE